MFRKKVKEDPTELQLLKIRVQNLEKQVAELKGAPQVQAEEIKKLVDLGIISLNDARSVVGILPVQAEELEKRITAFIKKSILEEITNGNRTIPEKSSFIPL
ncbi:hypothetical protein NQU17_02375 [Clostridiaceae bacterium HFYG-1003]|nr:hypothetical protein NQU17_02375 [Clostridiaceae bacterium HFYG-1003]